MRKVNLKQRLQRELFPKEHDPYSDWYLVYRQEVIEPILHWPANRRSDSSEDGTGDETINLTRVIS